MTDLFPESEIHRESPRLQWMKRHGLKTRDNGQAGEDELGEYGRWMAWAGDLEIARFSFAHSCGHGATEDEALADWARKCGVRMWFEEGKP